MKKYISLILCLLFVWTNSQAVEPQTRETDAHIFGHVLDKKTKEHLPYITIRLKGTTIGITTDATGHYFLRNLPVGNFTLEVTMIGFKTITKDVVIKAKTTQEIDFELEEETVSLDEVVVSANRNETTRRMAPSLVSVIGIKTLETTNSRTLSDGLKFQPGLRVENNCQNCGTTQIRINGLEGPYSQILIDSRPVIGALAGVYNLEQIPANMIERIEVIRGGGSALFGANAIGGTINVITREPIRNSGEFAHTTSSINATGALENNTTFNASLVNDSRNAGIMVFGQHRLRESFDMDGDGFSELPQLKNRALGFRSYLKTGVYSKLTLEYQNMHEFRRGGDRFDLQPFETHITEQAEHYINSASMKFDKFSANQKNRFSLYTAAQHTNRNSYYGGGEPYNDKLPEIHPNMSVNEIENIKNTIINNHLRKNSFGKTTELTYQVGGHYTHSFDNLWFMPADLTSGLEYLGSSLDDVSGFRKKSISQKTKTIGAFLQNEWKTSVWSFLLGGRVDKHNLVKNAIFSPRLNIRYNPTENINFRVTYSGGFRAPQVFDEDLHVDIAGGEQVIRVLSENLHEERSRSVSASVDYYHQTTNFQFNTLIEGFYTRLNNPFTNVKVGNEIRVENDTHSAAVYGINFEGKMAYRNVLDLQAGATFQKSEYDKARKWWEPENDEEKALDQVTATRRMMRTPNIYAYFVGTWNATKKFSVSLSGNYTGSMLVPHEAGSGQEGVHRFSKVNVTETTPSFFELNAKTTYTFNIHNDTQLQLNVGVQNIFNAFQKDFDTGAGRASSYIYGPGMPRTFFAGLKVTF
ncbi:MAG: TonB-dependent receptor [Bacteroidia bacterium]|nr:TonB-dependent receptor [Bacteroidia bacterium]